MSELLPHLARPAWLLLLPLLGWLLWRLWHRQRRLGRWQALLPAAFQPWLLSGGRGRQSRAPWLLLGLAWLLASLALLGPGWQRLEPAGQQRDDPLVAILELTPAMLAADLPPNRLEQARRKILDLLAVRGQAQTAIVVYAGSAHVLVPLTDDLATAQNLLAALKPAIMPEPGRRADLALRRALELLDQGANGQGRLLLLSGELSERERQGIQLALEGRSNPLAILGVGTASGAPIPQEDGGFLKDADGGIVLPRLHSERLASFAASLDGYYSNLRSDNRDLDSLDLLHSRGRTRGDGSQRHLLGWVDQGHWLLLPLLLLAACAGRRGWLFAFAALLIAPPPSYALDFDDLWWRADQQGRRLLDAGQPAAAAQRFEDPRWRGLAHYRAGDYAAAAEAFAEDDSAPSHYNRGNALALVGELEAALQAYAEALQRDPQLAAARHNRELVEQALRQHKREAQAAAQRQRAGESGESRPPSSASAARSERQTEEQAARSASSPTPAAGATPTVSTPARQAADAPSDSDAKTPAAAEPPASGEQRQALEYWLRQVPDDPGELLRRKFWYEQQRRQETSP